MPITPGDHTDVAEKRYKGGEGRERKNGMINYFGTAEKTLRARGYLDAALSNLERRRDRIIARGGPTEYRSPDFSKPYASTSAINDALTDCLELAEVVREIKQTTEERDEIDRVLAQLDKADREIITLWYIDRKSKDEIAAAVNYASYTSIYDLRNKAIAQFALLYFGAGALGSM